MKPDTPTKMQIGTKTKLLDMFLDRTTGETFSQNRLKTRRARGGNTALVAYGWLKIAEYNESLEAVTVFTGHKSLKSRTVSTYLNDVVKQAKERNRDVILSGESPTVNTPNEGARYINNYISFGGGRSAVEKEAVKTVTESLS